MSEATFLINVMTSIPARLGEMELAANNTFHKKENEAKPMMANVEIEIYFSYDMNTPVSNWSQKQPV